LSDEIAGRIRGVKRVDWNAFISEGGIGRLSLTSWVRIKVRAWWKVPKLIISSKSLLKIFMDAKSLSDLTL